MISRSGREKPTQTHNHNTRGGLGFCLLYCHTFFSYETTVPRTTSSQREKRRNIFELHIFMSMKASVYQGNKQGGEAWGVRNERYEADIGLFVLFLSIVHSGNPNEYSVCETGKASDARSSQLHFKPLSRSVCLWLCWNPGGGVLLFHVRLKGWSTRQAMHTGISHEKNCKCAPILRRVKLPVSNTALIKESF